MHQQDSVSNDARKREYAFEIAAAFGGLGQAVAILVDSNPFNLRSPIKMQNMPTGHLLDQFQIIDFAICPGIYTFSMRFTLMIGAMIYVTIREHFIAMTMPFVILPLSFINSLTLVNLNTITIFHFLF